MTVPLPDSVPARTPEQREKARVKLARKWAYLISTTTYVPLVHADLERPLAGLVDRVFAALAAEPLDLDAAEAIGAELVALHCADRKSLQCTVDVLAPALLGAGDAPPVDGLPLRVARLLGGVSAGFAEAVRRRTTEQQDSMCRALMEVARKVAADAEAREEESAELSTELTLLQRQLSHQLLHDALTGLPNRQFFTTRLEEVLNSGTATTLYRIELNGVPVLNDGLGGPRTDSFLTAIAVRIRSAVASENAMVARLDRAGFVVLREGGPGTAPPAALVDTINEALAETTYLGDVGVATTASIGVVQSPPHRSDPVELMSAADMALRYAKQKGPGQWQLLAPDEDAADRRLHRLAAIMPGAWETGQLRVGFRPRVGLADERPVAVDAFARWQQAGLRGQPCVELGEETGLSPQLSGWLLRNAGEQLRTWHRRTGAELPLGVSLTPVQSAAPDLVPSLLSVLDELSLRPSLVQVALPASTVFSGRALSNLTALAEAGVETAVHDFGDVPSDVVRLADLPLRSVLLTPRLVAQARGAAKTSLVAKALAGLVTFVHLAGATVTVEEIHNRAEADWWRWAEADHASGPLYGPAQERGDIASLFE